MLLQLAALLSPCCRLVCGRFMSWLSNWPGSDHDRGSSAGAREASRSDHCPHRVLVDVRRDLQFEPSVPPANPHADANVSGAPRGQPAAQGFKQDRQRNSKEVEVVQQAEDTLWAQAFPGLVSGSVPLSQIAATGTEQILAARPPGPPFYREQSGSLPPAAKGHLAGSSGGPAGPYWKTRVHDRGPLDHMGPGTSDRSGWDAASGIL